MMKRGRYSRPFLHFAILSVIAIGILLSPLLSSSYPIFSQGATIASIGPTENQSIVVGDNAFGTQISQKPRDKTIIYLVQRGDTLSSIAKKFGISTDTIKWANNLTSDNITVGDDLNILPVTGISYKVSSGDTIYTIAKKLDTNPQKIVDFPFNDFANPETFSLVVGQTLMVPDGVQPQAQPTYKQQVYIAAGPSTPSAGGFSWPIHGIITQFASWYHQALDIAAPYGTPILASNNGVVTKVDIGSYDGGYGNNVYVDGGNGYQTHYAHMSEVDVTAGQTVVAGSTVIGHIGLTGRTTGPHVHFEIIKNGVLVDPLPFLP